MQTELFLQVLYIGLLIERDLHVLAEISAAIKRLFWETCIIYGYSAEKIRKERFQTLLIIATLKYINKYRFLFLKRLSGSIFLNKIIYIYVYIVYPPAISSASTLEEIAFQRQGPPFVHTFMILC